MLLQTDAREWFIGHHQLSTLRCHGNRTHRMCVMDELKVEVLYESRAGATCTSARMWDLTSWDRDSQRCSYLGRSDCATSLPPERCTTPPSEVGTRLWTTSWREATSAGTYYGTMNENGFRCGVIDDSPQHDSTGIKTMTSHPRQPRIRRPSPRTIGSVFQWIDDAEATNCSGLHFVERQRS